MMNLGVLLATVLLNLSDCNQDFWLNESIKDIAFEDSYNLCEKLPSSTQASVYKCEHKRKHQQWAVQIVTKSLKKDAKEAIRTAISIHMKLHHENIVNLQEVYENITHIHLVLELATGGELFDRIAYRDVYSEKVASQAVKDIFRGLQYIHANMILHRDLQPGNLLYKDTTDNSRIKVAVLGLPITAEKDAHGTKVDCVPSYCAPEILKGEKYTKAADMWSIGVIVYTMLYGNKPFNGEDETQLCKSIMKGEYIFMGYDISENAKDLIRKLLTVDQAKRLTAAEALQYKWVQGIDVATDHMGDVQKKIKDFNFNARMLKNEVRRTCYET